MMKVLHVFNSTIVSGPETLVLPALRGLESHGVSAEAAFLTETRKAAESARVVNYARSLGLQTHEVAVRSRVDRVAVREFAELLMKLGPTVVHSHDVKASTYALGAAKLCRKDGVDFHLVSTHHGVRGRSGPRAKAYEWYYSRFVLPAFDRVLAVCSSDRELLVDRGLNPAKVIAHRNGVDRPRVDEAERSREADRLRREWRLDERGVLPGSRLIGFVGRIAPEKRIDRILKVVHHLDRGHGSLPEWNLLIFGTGPLEAQLKEESRRLGLERRVIWMGYRAGVGAELAGIDALIAMSDAEGLPINLVEAGWAGTPVLATAVDGILDLVPTSEHGVLVDLEEDERSVAGKMALLLSDVNQSRVMGKKYQAHIEEQFSGKVWLSRLSEIYSAIESGRLQ